VTLGTIWAFLVILAVAVSCFTGNGPLLGGAAMDGAYQAVQLCLSVGGMICLWSGLMELMRRCGMLSSLSRLLRPLLRRLYPGADRETLEDLSANLGANLLGLGNAATPAGIRAAQGLSRSGRDREELSRLVVMNTASLQLIPSTIAALRHAAGAAEPFDILPAVWISSLVSVCVGLLALKLTRRRR